MEKNPVRWKPFSKQIFEKVGERIIKENTVISIIVAVFSLKLRRLFFIEPNNIVTKLGIEDRVERLGKGNAYITVKDHK